jgi:hypothetical protein
MFFFSRTGRKTAHHYIKKKFRSKIDQYKPPEGGKLQTDYSPPAVIRPKPRLLNPLAPAMHHKEASFFISRMILGTTGEILSKTHALWCFQRHHIMRVARELKPARTCLGTLSSASLHHSWKFSSPGSGVHCCNPTNDNI